MESFIIIRKFALLKFQREFLILDFQTQNVLFTVKEDKLTWAQKILRILNISEVSFRFHVVSTDHSICSSFHKGFTFLTSKTIFSDSNSNTQAILKRVLSRRDNIKYILEMPKENCTYHLPFDTSTGNYQIIDDNHKVIATIIRDSPEVSQLRKTFSTTDHRWHSIYVINFSDALLNHSLKQNLFAPVSICMELLYLDQLE